MRSFKERHGSFVTDFYGLSNLSFERFLVNIILFIYLLTHNAKQTVIQLDDTTL